MTDKTEKGVMDYFPLSHARPTQEAVIREIDSLFKSGRKVVILEAPVGSGKSAVAITLALQQAANPSKVPREEGADPPLPVHILTPRKSLQDQYYDDFPSHIVTMKGRNAYPCTKDAEYREYAPVMRIVAEGKSPPYNPALPRCSEAPCLDDKRVADRCKEDQGCPYALAMDIAQKHEIVVHNLHSFLYQTNFSERFQVRSKLIVDEAHEIENIIRDFATRKVTTHAIITREEAEQIKGVTNWIAFLKTPDKIPSEKPADASRKAADPKYKSKRDEYLEMILALEKNVPAYEKGISVDVIPIIKPGGNTRTGTILVFVPHYVGNEVQRLIMAHGDQVLLMSGTIYNKDQYCRSLGINPSDASFIRISSSFPKENRPIYMKPEYQVDTSHRMWDENFDQMIEIIRKIMAVFHDAKGLIHAPSYSAARQLTMALADPRIRTHEPENFLTSLENFFESKGNGVFISPVCQQGVDFKGDRSRFQIIVRVPNMSTSSVFVNDKVKNDFPWYNYQTLLTFGQQIGRINRSEDDYGATFLLDSRFHSFIRRNQGVIPRWVKDAIIYR